ncbi:MAG: LPS export ABC transporter periplasmic protein LptC [Rickettsiales bacterium]|nr:LPS export ABC transporter periplasmic protein LptC [Rickettsiales bacterium]
MKVLMLVLVGIVFLALLLPYSGIQTEELKLKIPKVNIKNPSVFTLTNAKFFGTDEENRPFSIEIKKAIERNSEDQNIVLSDIEGEINISDTKWAGLSASKGRYNKETRIINLFENVTLLTEDGYKIDTSSIDINTTNMTAHSDSRVIIQHGLNTIESQGLDFSLKGNIILKGKIKATISENTLKELNEK